MDGNLNFYSVSSDGRVVTWRLVKVHIAATHCIEGNGEAQFLVCTPPPPLPTSLLQNELQYQDAVQLKIPEMTVQGPEGVENTAISELEHYSLCLH